MPRKYRYSEKGKRCYGIQDWHTKGRVKALGAIIGNTLLTLSLFETKVNSTIFFTWLTKDLLPKLPQNSVIVMDNASFHKRPDIREAIENGHHTLEYLPPYSPDKNPIEHKWAQAKAVRRRERCSVEEIFSLHMEYIKI